MSILTIPFTYILKFKPSNQWYYGVRWARGCSPDDLWVNYFTSSSAIKKMIAEFGVDSFEFRVSKVFKTKKEAIEHECKFLMRVNAASNGSFINKRNNLPSFSAYGLKRILHKELQIQTWHDPNIPLPLGWEYGTTDKHRKSNSASHMGQTPWNKGKSTGKTRPCSDSRKNNIKSARLLTSKLKCPHCGKECDPGNYKRFHGDNCKLNPNISHETLLLTKEKCQKGYLSQVKNGNFNPVKPQYGDYICPYCGTHGTNYGNMMLHHFDRCKSKSA